MQMSIIEVFYAYGHFNDTHSSYADSAQLECMHTKCCGVVQILIFGIISVSDRKTLSACIQTTYPGLETTLLTPISERSCFQLTGCHAGYVQLIRRFKHIEIILTLKKKRLYREHFV